MGALESGLLLNDVRSTPPDEAFLIGDILSTTVTTLSGDPKVGKSLLVAGMLRAMLGTGTEFVGFPVHRHLKRVAYGWTDPGGDEELKARMPANLGSRILSFSARNANDDFWVGLADDLRRTRASDQGFDLVVLDNIIGSLGEGDDIAEAKLASEYMRRVELVTAVGVPVLLVSHTPKSNGEGLAVASSPTGGRAFSAGARAISVLRHGGKKGLRLQVTSNRGTGDQEVLLEVHRETPDSEVPVWSRRQPRTPDPKRGSTQGENQAAKAADLIVEKGLGLTSWAKLAEAVASDGGMKANTLRLKLPDLLEFDAASGVYRRRSERVGN